MKKLSKLNQIHGKIENFQPTSLDQVWGDTGLSKYKTLDINKYTESLAQMNLTDLQAHAIKVGEIPTADNRDVLTKRLLKAFHLFIGNYRMPKQPKNSNTPPSQKALKILSEGR